MRTFTKEELAESMAAIGRMPVGEALRHYLVLTIQDVIPDNSSDGALRVNEARRNFAKRLLDLLDPIDAPSGTDTNISLQRRGSRVVSNKPNVSRRRGVNSK